MTNKFKGIWKEQKRPCEPVKYFDYSNLLDDKKGVLSLKNN